MASLSDVKTPLPTATPHAAGPRPRSLRVLAADPGQSDREAYQKVLPALGHMVCVAETGRQALDLCRASTPDLVIAAARFPDGDGFELAGSLCRDHPVPVILSGDGLDAGVVWGAAECAVLGYLPKPLCRESLGATIAVALRTFDQLAALRTEAAQLRQALEDRKVIERAKGVIMRYAQASEETAYRRMQKLATDRGQKLVDVARSIRAAGEVFAQLARDDGASAMSSAGRGPRSFGTGNGHSSSSPVEG